MEGIGPAAFHKELAAPYLYPLVRVEVERGGDKCRSSNGRGGEHHAVVEQLLHTPSKLLVEHSQYDAQVTIGVLGRKCGVYIRYVVGLGDYHGASVRDSRFSEDRLLPVIALDESGSQAARPLAERLSRRVGDYDHFFPEATQLFERAEA